MQPSALSTSSASAEPGGIRSRAAAAGTNHGFTLAHCAQNGRDVDDQVPDDGQPGERRDLDRVASSGMTDAAGERAPAVHPDAAGPAHPDAARVAEGERRIVRPLDPRRAGRAP